jgi:hypothetical protein
MNPTSLDTQHTRRKQKKRKAMVLNHLFVQKKKKDFVLISWVAVFSEFEEKWRVTEIEGRRHCSPVCHL